MSGPLKTLVLIVPSAPLKGGSAGQDLPWHTLDLVYRSVSTSAVVQEVMMSQLPAAGSRSSVAAEACPGRSNPIF